MNWSKQEARPEPARRFYRALLRAYPSRFRLRYGAEAERVFGKLYQDARARGRLPALRLLLRSALHVPYHGWKERTAMRREQRRAGGRKRRASVSLRSQLDGLISDFRQAVRSLRKAPVFSATAILIVGVGLGATTTIFSVVDGVLLRPLPYPDSERLVRPLLGRSAVPIPDYVQWRDRTTSFDAWAAAWDVSMDLTGSGEPTRIETARVTPRLLSLLGARVGTGRLLTEADFDPAAPRVAVITERLWSQRWAADPGLIGRTILLSGEPVEVVGVMGAEFQGPEALELDDVDIYVPLYRSLPEYEARDYYILAVVARLAPEVTLSSARAELAALARALAQDDPERYGPRDDGRVIIRAQTLKEATVGEIGSTLYMFLGAVAFMLVIACANIANLFLARGTGRDHEMAVRLALGAGRRRIVRQLLTEAVLISLLGGALGVALAFLGVEVFRAVNPGGIPRLAEVGVDLRVLGFAFALSTLTGIGFGIVPAINSARTDGGGALREADTRTTPGARGSRSRNALVVLEVSLALVLLAGAGLLFNSFLHLRQVDTGLEPEGVLTVQLNLEAAYEGQDRVRFAESLLADMAEAPGVNAVGASWRLPFDRGRCCWRSSAWADAGTDTIGPYIHPVTANYFEALGIRLLRGRVFDRSDEAIDPVWPRGEPAERHAEVIIEGKRALPVIVNRTLARRFWPDRDPLQQQLYIYSLRAIDLRVVGVVDDVRHWALDAETGEQVYVPFAPFAGGIGLLDVAIRHDAPVRDLTARIRTAVRSLDPALPLGPIASMDARISRSIATPRFYTVLLGTFATIAFALAAAGIYGSMLYTVGQRRRELGIRIALGALPSDVVGMVLARGLLLTGLGTALGLSAALLLSRTLEKLVFGIGTRDPTTLLTAALGLAVVAMAACYLPARQASRTDPVETLRRSR